MTPTLEEKLQVLRASLGELGRVVVAFSGGVDSAFLLAFAHQALGDDCLGVTAVSGSLAESERREAEAFCRARNIPWRVIETHEMAREGYRANDTNRCYFCKSELFDALKALAEREGFRAVCDGFIADDLSDFRPGRQAGAERGVRSPLFEAGLTKADIRQASRALGLPTSDKHASACLASRIPYGTEVTTERLRQVEAAEAALRALGFGQLRVRCHDPVARIEISPAEFAHAVAHREEIVSALRQTGFHYVTLDLQGFRSGSMNETADVKAPATAGNRDR